MGFRIEHLTVDELAAIRRAEEPRAEVELHLYQCLSCKRNLADSVLLGHFIGRDPESKEASRVSGVHPANDALQRYHQAAYEAYDLSPREFLRIDRHLRQCNRCFVAYSKIHRKLSPPPHLFDRIAKRMETVSPPVVGTLTVAVEVITRALVQFNPARISSDTESGYEEVNNFAADVPAFARMSESRREKAPPAAIRFLVGDVLVEVEIPENSPNALLRIKTRDGQHTKEGFVIQSIGEGGEILEAAKSDREGYAALRLRPDVHRLRFQPQDLKASIDVRLDFRSRL